MKDAVKLTVIERLGVLQALATRLEKVLQDDVPGMALARMAVDVDHAVVVLTDHASKLETTK